MEYKGPDDPLPVRELQKTAMRYIKNEMPEDLIPLIPWSYIFTFKNSRLFYLIKAIRIKKIGKLLNARKFQILTSIFF